MTTELSKPKGHGLVRVAHNLRVHAPTNQEWGAYAATDYWANFGNPDAIPANAIGDPDLYGWATTGYSHTLGSAADFLSSTDVGTTGGINFDAAGDYIASPPIFGDYANALLAGQILGYMPTALNMECYARFAANNNEEETGFGFVHSDAAVPFVKAGLMALITSDGTNFSLESSAAADAGSTDNTTAHQFRITISGTTAEWFIDGTSQGTIAIVADKWPAKWGVSTKAATGANDPVVSWVHIWYS
jgi:hypothetical protein